MYRGLAIAAATITACTLIIYAVGTSADTTSCPSGTVPITAATRADATAAGIPTSAQCWNPNDANAGQAAGAAKLWLAQHATQNSNISCLNAQYAEKLQALMEAVPGGPPVITDGYRSPQQQANLPKGATEVGACGSYHQYGMAADFNNASKQTLLWMRENAPQFGLTEIPSLNIQTGCSYHSSFCDPGHIQIQGPLPPRNQCGICSSTGGNGSLPAASVPQAPDDISSAALQETPTYFCSGSTIMYRNPSGATQAVQMCAYGCSFGQCNPSPSMGMTGSLGQVPPASGAQSPTVSGQQCAPQFSCVNNTIYLQTTACTNQVYQTCQYGCAGTVCLPNPASSTSPIIGTTYPIVVPSTTPAASLLEQFANPVLIATATPNAGPSLTSGIYNVISPLTGSTTNDQQTLGQNPSDSGIYGQQTFPSASSQLSGGYTLAPSAIVSVLQNLQTALQHLFSYLVSIGK